MNDSDNTSPPGDSPGGESTPAASTPQAIPSSPIHVVLEPPRRPGRRLLALVGWLGFLFCALLLMSQWSARQEYLNRSEGIRERFHSGDSASTDKIAIIAVRGVILDGDGFVKRQIDRIRDDADVRAVVLRVDSPGGTVTGSDYIYHHLKRLCEQRSLPLIVSMGSIATSGGYYVSMAVGDQQRSIYAEPTTTTGSIGVVVPHYDISGLLARLDIVDNSIASHPRKRLLSITHSMSNEDRRIIEAYVNESFRRFKSIIKQGRPELREANPAGGLADPETKRNLATGEIFTATQAKQFGLIDEIGFIEDAIARAAELAQLDPDQVRVVEYVRPPTLFDLAGLAQAAEPPDSVSTLLELSTPRAFFLSTSLPSLVSNSQRDSHR